MKVQVIEVPDYRGLLQRLADMLERSFASTVDAVQEYDTLANEARTILKSAPDVQGMTIDDAWSAAERNGWEIVATEHRLGRPLSHRWHVQALRYPRDPRHGPPERADGWGPTVVDALDNLAGLLMDRTPR